MTFGHESRPNGRSKNWQGGESINPMRVLIVEDETTLANLIERNLAAHGYKAAIAGTAAAAIASMLDVWPDVLLLDISLPDASGWDVLRRFQGDPRNTRVLVMSAAPVSQKRIEEFRPAHVLQKPFLIPSLLHAIADGDGIPVEGERTGPA